MRAILVATRGDDRIFYDLDSRPGGNDGMLGKSNGSAVPVNVISWAGKANGVNFIRDSKFHRFLWDAPQNIGAGKWFETFVKKSIPVDQAKLEGVEVLSSLDRYQKPQPKEKVIKVKSVDNGSFVKVVDYKSGKYVKTRYSF